MAAVIERLQAAARAAQEGDTEAAAKVQDIFYQGHVTALFISARLGAQVVETNTGAAEQEQHLLLAMFSACLLQSRLTIAVVLNSSDP